MSNPKILEQSLLIPEGFPHLPEQWTLESFQFTPERCEKNKQPTVNSEIFVYCFKKHHFNSGRILIVVHGLGEHGGRYQHFAHYLNDSVDAIYCIDHQGHGRSFGIRGYVENFSHFCEDVVSLIRKIEAKHAENVPQPKLFLFGHSMGGLITFLLAQKYSQLNLAGVILSAPLIKIAGPVPFYKHLPGMLLTYVWDRLEIPNGLDVHALSHDAQVVKNYQNDELNHNKITPRLYSEMNRCMAEIASSTFKKEIHYPFLFLIPSADKIVSAEAAVALFKELKAPQKTLKEFPGFFHEPHNEPQKELVFKCIREFIECK